MDQIISPFIKGRLLRPANEGCLGFILKVAEMSFLVTRDSPNILETIGLCWLKNEPMEIGLLISPTHTLLTKEKTRTVNYAGLINIVADIDYTLLLFSCNGFALLFRLENNHD
jgi:hypothetical protein